MRCPSPPLPPVTSATAPLRSISFLLLAGARFSRSAAPCQRTVWCPAREQASHRAGEARKLIVAPRPNGGAPSHAPEPTLSVRCARTRSDASIERNEVISDAATGWRTQGTGFGYSAGVTAHLSTRSPSCFNDLVHSVSQKTSA